MFGANTAFGFPVVLLCLRARVIASVSARVYTHTRQRVRLRAIHSSSVIACQ